jgi:PAS domain S-box-containing protein
VIFLRAALRVPTLNKRSHWLYEIQGADRATREPMGIRNGDVCELVAERLLAIDDVILDLLPVAVYVCNRDGVIVRYNRSAASLWGREPVRGHQNERFCGAWRLRWPDGAPLPHDRCPMAEALRTGSSVRNAEIIIERPDGGKIWALANIQPIRDDSGQLIGAINCLQDVTARKQAERHLLDALPAAIYMTDAAGCLTFFNEAAVQMAGRRPTIGEDRWCVSWRMFYPDGRPMAHGECPMAISLKEGRDVRGAEIVVERPDGQRVLVLPYPTILRDDSGRIIGAVNMLVDISERAAAERRKRLLINELNHRVKNTLASVQSIAMQTFRNEAERPALRWFEGRLMALSRAHDVLTRENWEGVGLKEIVSRAVERNRGHLGDRFFLAGPDLRIQPRLALSLSMVLHELCINASQYGALRNEEGRVGILWNVARELDGEHLALTWRETGGPPVRPPRHKGFGTRLIQRSLAHEFGGSADLAFDRAGVLCTIRVPLQENGDECTPDIDG